MNDELKALVRRRASDRCEYCHLPQSGSTVDFQVDHVLARKHGGTTVANNLAYACIYCNGFKGTDITGIDPNTGEVAFLFNPRTDQWQEHFNWSGPIVVGITATGRATVRTLRINSPWAVELRASLAEEGKLDFKS